MRAKPRDFLVGFFFPFVCFAYLIKYVRWYFSRKISPQKAPTYPRIDRLQIDRPNSEFHLYFLSMFSPIPLSILVLWFSSFYGLEIKQLVNHILAITSSVWYLSSAAFFVLTLFLPIGDTCLQKDKDRRLFLGIPTISKFLQARDAVISRCLYEMLFMLMLTVLGAAISIYMIYGWKGDEGVTIANGLIKHIRSKEEGLFVFGFPYFIYFSLITFTTTGYGDIVPVLPLAIWVIIAELSAGFVFLTGIIPPLIGLITLRTSEVSAKASRAFGPHALEQAVLGGIDWLRKNKQASGNWSGLEVDDPCPIVTIALALQSAGNVKEADILLNPNVRHKSTASSLAAALRGIFDEKRCLNHLESEKMMKSFTLSSEEIPIVLLFGVATGKMDKAILETMVPGLSVTAWDNLYGEHWGTYGLVADFLKTPEESLPEIKSKLLSRKNSTKNFYGDVILTSLICCALCTGRGRQLAWGDHTDALTWLRKGGPGLITTPFDSLDVWDTAWAILTLRKLGIAYQEISESLNWLQRVFMSTPFGEGWSWSPQSSILCIDSTSLICESIAFDDFSDARLNRIILRTLNNLFNKYPFQDGMCPTFIGLNTKTEPCPVITARILSLRGYGLRISENWSQLIQRVLNGEKSPWFTDENITKGLVLHYASKAMVTSLPKCQQLFEETIKQLEKGTITTLEGKLSTIIGCTNFMHYSDLSKDQENKSLKALGQVIDTCLMEQNIDRSWNPQEVGRFGFGIKYRDRVFTTCLGIIAFNNYHELNRK
jgi:voltage-gated potassium channel Kch